MTTTSQAQGAISLVDLKAQYLYLKREVHEAIEDVLARGDFIQGEDVLAFEEEFARFCGASEAVGVASGTEALRLALLSCGIGQGDEVITTPFTFIATAEAISLVGASPVFADIDSDSCNLGPGKIEQAITPRTKAIIPVHLYGRPAEMDPILAVAKRHGLYVIEDAAQAHGALYKGKAAGTMGDLGCFSFYPGKNLGAYGDAGLVVTNNRDRAGRIRLLRDHGRAEKYEHLCVGTNARLDTMQAAVLRVKLRYLDIWNARRRLIASVYRHWLQNLPLTLPSENAGETAVYHQFVIRTPCRDHVRRVLGDKGIATGIHYPTPLHLQPAYRHLGYRVGSFPESERAASHVLSLPIYPELSESQAFRIAEAVEVALSAW